MKDDQNGRRPRWKTTKMEDNQNERRPASQLSMQTSPRVAHAKLPGPKVLDVRFIRTNNAAIYQYMAHLWKMQMYLQKYSKLGCFEYICRCICIYSSWNLEGLTLHLIVPWFNPAHSAKDHIRVARIHCENILKEKLENKRFWLTLENNQTLNIPFFINRAWQIKTLLMP